MDVCRVKDEDTKMDSGSSNTLTLYLLLAFLFLNQCAGGARDNRSEEEGDRAGMLE
jgi:hypothetical protein